MTNKNEEVFISRIVDAPREQVFQAWTDPEELEKWFAPKGCTIHFSQIDIREGGTFHSVVKNPAYKDCWCKGTYLEIVEPERIVFTMAIADEAGNLVTPADAGMDPAWPEVTTVTVTFGAMGDKTAFTLHQTVNETLAKRTGAYPGWLDMLDILEAHLNGGVLN
jgi:uncharacterized protein YndB with AHSA1/START domain